MKNIIHFHVTTPEKSKYYNLGDTAIAYSIKDMMHNNLKISRYDSWNILQLKKMEFKEWFFSIINSKKKVNRQDLLFIKLMLNKLFLSHKIINEYDLCIIGGGGLYSNFYFPMDNNFLKKIKIPIILYGIGYNADIGYNLKNYLNKKQQYSIYLLNKLSKLSSVRDPLSYKFLNELNINEVDIIGDPAIFLKSKRIDNLILNDAPYKIGINIAQHGWKMQSKYINNLIITYIKTCKFLIKNYGAKIIYLKHTPRDDYAINILRKFIPIEIANYNPYQMKYIYDSLDLVIGMMLHSTIFAF